MHQFNWPGLQKAPLSHICTFATQLAIKADNHRQRSLPDLQCYNMQSRTIQIMIYELWSTFHNTNKHLHMQKFDKG